MSHPRCRPAAAANASTSSAAASHPACRQQAALVSRRFAALCCIPELLRDVATPYVDSLPALLSFMAWLVRHGRHVLRLDFTARPAPPLDEGCWTAAVVSCLAASGTAGQLAELQFSYLLPLPLHTEWLAIMRSLRCLCLDGDAIHISPAISGLTALQSLELSSMEIINLTAGARLPTSMTRLCVTTDGAEQMPEQVKCGSTSGQTRLCLTVAVSLSSQFAQLPRLQRLRLDGCRYSAESMQQLSSLGGSLTRLDTASVDVPAAALSALTRLQHLDWYGTDSTAVEDALQHLPGLTCLVSPLEGAGVLVRVCGMLPPPARAASMTPPMPPLGSAFHSGGAAAGAVCRIRPGPAAARAERPVPPAAVPPGALG